MNGCPRCRKTGRPVGDGTVAALLHEPAAGRLLGVDRRFCRTPSCEVVYYGADGRLALKTDARVRVGIKETDDPIPLCYCFDVSREDVWNEIAQVGASTIAERIATEVRACRCACETKNPSGACCLGEIQAAARDAFQTQPVPRRAAPAKR